MGKILSLGLGTVPEMGIMNVVSVHFYSKRSLLFSIPFSKLYLYVYKKKSFKQKY